MTTKYMNGSGGVSPTEAPAQSKRRKSSPKAPAPTAAPLSVPAPWFDFSPKQILTWGSGLILTLIGAGWLTLPAKQSELLALAKDMKAGFERIDAGFRSIDLKFQALDQKMEGLRNDLVRVQTLQDVQASAPATPARPIRPIRKIKEPVKATNVFGF